MPVDFHKEMSKYLGGRRRKRFLSKVRYKIINKKARFVYFLSVAFSKSVFLMRGLEEKLRNKRERGKNKRIGIYRFLGFRFKSFFVKPKPKVEQKEVRVKREKARVEPDFRKKHRRLKNPLRIFKRAFSFIEIKTAEEIEREEKERKRAEERRAIEEAARINKMLDEGIREMESLEYSSNENSFSSETSQEEGEKVIELDDGYKIRVVRSG